MAKYFSPLLLKGSGAFGQQPAEKAKEHSGIIVNITAKVGSIGDNGIWCLRNTVHAYHAGCTTLVASAKRQDTLTKQIFTF